MKTVKNLFFVIAVLFTSNVFAQKGTFIPLTCTNPVVGENVRTGAPVLLVETPAEKYTVYENGDFARKDENGIYYFIATRKGTVVWEQKSPAHAAKTIIGYVAKKPKDIDLVAFNKNILQPMPALASNYIAKN